MLNKKEVVEEKKRGDIHWKKISKEAIQSGEEDTLESVDAFLEVLVGGFIVFAKGKTLVCSRAYIKV